MVFALAVFRFTRPMMLDRLSGHVALQLFRAATAVAANYRAACLGRSRAEFIAKLGVVREAVDEVVFWLEFADRSGLTSGPAVATVAAEARELAAIIAASYRTAKAGTGRPEIAE